MSVNLNNLNLLNQYSTKMDFNNLDAKAPLKANDEFAKETQVDYNAITGNLRDISTNIDESVLVNETAPKREIINFNGSEYVKYFNTTDFYVVDKETDEKLLSKLNSAEKAYLLYKGNETNADTMVASYDFLMNKLIDKMVTSQTNNILGNVGVAIDKSSIINYSFATKFDETLQATTQTIQNRFGKTSELITPIYDNVALDEYYFIKNEERESGDGKYFYTMSYNDTWNRLGGLAGLDEQAISNSAIFIDKNNTGPGSISHIASYMNDYARDSLIDTKYGKAQVFLDLKGDNDSLGIGGLKYNFQLFMLDSDDNGVLDARDEYFDKLKIRAYDENGDEIVMKLSDVMGSFKLTDFMNSKEEAKAIYSSQFSSIDDELQKRIDDSFDTYNPYGNFSADVRYEKMDNNDIAKLKSMESSDGWIHIDTPNAKLFGSIGIGYAGVGIDGKLHINELQAGNIDLNWTYANYGGFRGGLDGFGKYETYNVLAGENFENNLKDKVNYIYNSYMKELDALKDFFGSYDGDIDIMDFKSTTMIGLEREFKDLTGVEFSLDNLKELKHQSDNNTLLNKLISQDALKALKVNDNGTFTLRFASGEEITVSELFKDSGGLLDNESLAINADDFSQEELNNIIVSLGTIIDDKNDGKAISLSELGINAIEKLGGGKFLLKGDEQSYKVSDLYFMRILDDKEPSKSENSLKFYPKPIDIFA